MEISNPSVSINAPQVTHRDIDYYIEPLIFRVEDKLFRVPREYLSQESSVFLDLLQLPQPTNEGSVAEEGSTDATPVILPEPVTAFAFRTFLSILYPYDSSDLGMQFTKDEWLEVLELSRMWDMSTIRKMAIQHLLPLLEDDPAHKWNLSKKYEISDWTQPALEKLVRRNSPLGSREFHMLDQETLLKVAAVRESCYPVCYDSDNQYGYYGSQENRDIARWEIRQERGEIVGLDFSSFVFECPPPSLPQQVSEDTTSEPDGPWKSGEFYFEKVVFKVEDRLYRVPNQPFSQHSPIFRRDFERRGFSKYDYHDPFVVEGVAKTDFENLLRLFFPPKLLGEREPTSEEWASILRLSARWDMGQVKNLSVRKLENLDFGNIATKLQMAQELGVQEWFSSGMKTLIARREPLAALECQVLSERHVLQVLDLRERGHFRYNSYYGNLTHIRAERGEVPVEVDLSARLAGLS